MTRMVGTRVEPITPDCAVTVDIHVYVYANGVRMTFTVPSYCLVSGDFSSFWDLLAVQALFLFGNDPLLGTVSGVRRRSYPNTVYPFGTNLEILEGGEYDVLLSPVYAMNITNSVVVGTSAATSAVSMTCDVILGYQAAMAMQYGNSNVLLGCDVAGGSTSGNNNVYLGAGAGYYTNGNNNIFLGFGAGYNLSSASNTLIIGLCADAFLHGDMTSRVLTVSGETRSRAVGIESLKLTRTVSGNLYYDDSVANISGHVYTEDYPPPGTLPNLFYTAPNRVGVNTASPSTQLDVSGALYVSSGATISGNLDVYGDISCTTLYATVSSVYLGTLQLSRNPSGFLFLNDSTANVSGIVYSGGDPETGNFSSAVISSNLSAGSLTVSGGSTLASLAVTSNVSAATLTTTGLATLGSITTTGTANLSNVNISGTTNTSTLNVIGGNLNVNSGGAATLYLNSSASPFGADVYLTNNGVAWALAGTYNNGEGNSIGGNTVSKSLNFSISGERYMTFGLNSINISAAAPLTVQSTATFNSNLTSTGIAALSNVNISGTLNTVGLGRFSNITSTGTGNLSNVNISGALTVISNGAFGNFVKVGGQGDRTYISGQGAYLSWNNTAGGGRTDIACQRGGGGGGFDFTVYDSSNTIVNQPISTTSTGVTVSSTLTTTGTASFRNNVNISSNLSVSGEYIFVAGVNNSAYIQAGTGQGSYFSWNNDGGSGYSEFGCQRGGGSGGFRHRVWNSSASLVGDVATMNLLGSTFAGYLATTGNQVSGGVFFVGDVSSAAHWQLALVGQRNFGFLRNTSGASVGGNYSLLSYINDTGNYNLFSDLRLKNDIKPLNTEHSYRRILGLSPKSYIYNDSTDVSTRNVGFIAQEVQEVNPHCTQPMKVRADDETEYYSLCYNDILIHSVGAIQEQSKQIKKMQDALVTLGIDICSL